MFDHLGSEFVSFLLAFVVVGGGVHALNTKTKFFKKRKISSFLIGSVIFELLMFILAKYFDFSFNFVFYIPANNIINHFSLILRIILILIIISLIYYEIKFFIQRRRNKNHDKSAGKKLDGPHIHEGKNTRPAQSDEIPGGGK